MSGSTQVALLRGINVGGRTKLAMADLRELVSGLGYPDVRTHLNSGNVVFTNTTSGPGVAARRIEEAITEDLGLNVAVLARTRDELAEVVAADPFQGVATDPSRYFVAFLAGLPTTADLGATEPDQAVLVGREGYLWCPNGARQTRLTNVWLERRLGVVATTRNWNTVCRLLGLADE